MSKYKPVKNPMSASEAARCGKRASPWSLGPHCSTPKALKSNTRYKSAQREREVK